MVTPVGNVLYHREGAMFDIQDWLYRELREFVGSGACAVIMSLQLADQLDRIGQRLGFSVESDPWVSSRFEEAEVSVRWKDGRQAVIRACVIPYVPKAPTQYFEIKRSVCA